MTTATVPEFTQSFDARDWAAAFVERVKKNPALATDEGAMLGWFANALMRGFDEADNRKHITLKEGQTATMRVTADPSQCIIPAWLTPTPSTPSAYYCPPVISTSVPLMASGAHHRCIACGVEHGSCCGSCPQYRP